jgi:hypothetical protein
LIDFLFSLGAGLPEWCWRAIFSVLSGRSSHSSSAFTEALGQSLRTSSSASTCWLWTGYPLSTHVIYIYSTLFYARAGVVVITFVSQFAGGCYIRLSFCHHRITIQMHTKNCLGRNTALVRAQRSVRGTRSEYLLVFAPQQLRTWT